MQRVKPGSVLQLYLLNICPFNTLVWVLDVCLKDNCTEIIHCFMTAVACVVSPLLAVKISPKRMKYASVVLALKFVHLAFISV